MAKNLKEIAYDFIKEKIINCEYMPGDFLDEKLIVSEIGASRTPIREAINKLEQENLLTILPKKGILVTQLSYKDILDIYELRIMLEPQIIVDIGDKIDKQVIKKFMKDVQTLKLNGEAIIHDDLVHNYFANLQGNQYVINILSAVRTQNNRIRFLNTRKTSACSNYTLIEHSDIFNAILKDDYVEAANKMRIHIQNSKERTLNTILKTL